MMKKIKKSLALAVLAFVAAASLLVFKPVRAWASAEGSYMYRQLILRPITTASRVACSSLTEGYIIYDPTVHSIAFCDGTSYHKLVSNAGASDDYWTIY